MTTESMPAFLQLALILVSPFTLDASQVSEMSDRSHPEEQVLYVTTESFKSEVLESNLPVLVDFTATWCRPCKILDPIIDGLLPEMSGHAKIFKLDIDESPEIYTQFQLVGVPTVLFFNKGIEQDRIIGPQSREVYIKYLEGLKRGRPALDIKIALLGEDSFRREFIENQRPDEIREALKQFPNLLTEAFENGQSPLSLILNSLVGDREERINLVLAGNPTITAANLVGLGRCEEFENLVTQDPETVNRPDSDGNTHLLTALIQAGRLKESSCLRTVLDAGADPGIQDTSRFTLGRAAVSSPEVLEELLEKGMDPNHVDREGRNALHWAAFYGYPHPVKVLLNYGMDPTVQALNGETAADIVRFNRTQWITALKESGLNPNTGGVLDIHNEVIALLEDSESIAE